MKIKFIKILAYGSLKRFAWVEINGKVFALRISDELYGYLYRLGVPTSQKLRLHK